MNDDSYGSARRDLEVLRSELMAKNAGIGFPSQSPSAARLGEYRFTLPNGESVYVQGPLTRTGRMRTDGWSWRYYYNKQLHHCGSRREILNEIATLASAARDLR